MLFPLAPNAHAVVQALHAVDSMHKVASVFDSDDDILQKTSEAEILLYDEIFQQVKEAGMKATCDLPNGRYPCHSPTAFALSTFGTSLFGMSKTASADRGSVKEHVGELAEKLGAIGLIEDRIDATLQKELTKEAKELLVQVRLINRAYGVQLLREACG